MDFLDRLFTVALEALQPRFLETAKSNFRAIARGGLSTGYLFLICYVDYEVDEYILGSGPQTVTVAYDLMGEARSFELYRREHASGTWGEATFQAEDDYENSLGTVVEEAEALLAERIGGNEGVVFLAPMGAHNTGFQVLRRRPDHGEFELLVHVADTDSVDTTYTDSSLEPGARYVYRVKAINSAGIGPYSYRVKATTARVP